MATAPRRRDVRQVRADRAAATGNAVAVAAAAILWLIVRTFPRVLPFYWALTSVAVAAAAGRLGLRWTLVALLALVAVAAAAAWPARRLVRVYRTAVAVTFGAFATAVAAAGGHAAIAAHPTLTLFGPTLAAAVLGWPWWYHLRDREAADTATAGPESTPDQALTEYWSERWQREVVANDVCKGTRLVSASSPRPGVTEAIIRLSAGRTKAIMGQGNDIEVQLDLAEGAVGWRSTGRAAKVLVTIVERSYIENGVTWTGPTYQSGRCQLTTFSDGTPGWWVFSRPRFGMLNGLVVGSTGTGKSVALSVLIENLLAGGWMVPVGDPQNGQSLPQWNAASEYHDGVDAVEQLLRRLHAEVMRRSQMLAAAGVAVYDADDPRVQALDLPPIMAVVDEVHMVLDPRNKPLVAITEELVAISRKTGVGVILATQMPQMKSLGGSIRIRDALVAGNLFALRLSNRGSGTTVLPDDHVGDPFALPGEIDGNTTAGMGYLRTTSQVGMLSRVPNQDLAAAAAAAPRVPMRWQVPPPPPINASKTTQTANVKTVPTGPADKLRALFGVGPKTTATVTEARPPANTREWVIGCLRKGPASAQALLDRPDCPVKQAQLYTVLDRLVEDGRIAPPTRRGGPYRIDPARAAR